MNVGKLSIGADALIPRTPLGCMLLIKRVRSQLARLHAVIVGRSNIVGKTLAQLLLRENCTVTVAHSKTDDLASVCRRSDILVAAVGQPALIRGEWIKPGAIVIDVGINRIKHEGRRRLVGDVDFGSARLVAGALPPVPGGVGPMTIACLLRNTIEAACRRHGVAWLIATACPVFQKASREECRYRALSDLQARLDSPFLFGTRCLPR